MPDEQGNRNDTKEKWRKRTREGDSQTDEEDATGVHTCRQPCGQCSVATNSRLSSIEEKLNLLLSGGTRELTLKCKFKCYINP